MSVRAALYTLAAAALWYAGGRHDADVLLVAALAMALLGVLSFVLSRVSLAGLDVDIEASCIEAVVASEATFSLTVVNACPLPLAMCRVELETPPAGIRARGRQLARGRARTSVFVTVAGRHRAQVPVLVDAPHCGLVELRVSNVTAFDPLGLFPAKSRASRAASVPIVPKGGFPVNVDARLVTCSGRIDVPEAQQGSSAGPEPPEVLDVRAWQPGDPLGTVHWKLSARTGTMQSRRYASRGTADTVVLFDPCTEPLAEPAEMPLDGYDPSSFDAWCEAALNLAEGLENAGVTFVALWPRPPLSDSPVGELVVNSAQGVRTLVRAIVSTVSAPGRSERAAAIRRAAELSGGSACLCLGDGPLLCCDNVPIAAFDGTGRVFTADSDPVVPQTARTGRT